MPVIAHRLVVGVAALLVAAVVVRNAAVEALVPENAERAVKIWPGHPAAELALAMIEVGRSARAGNPPQDLFQQVDAAARRAPLSLEPYLVRGVQAQVAGNLTLAEQAFSAAERRDPRSLPAHYFLAEQYFRVGNAERGFSELVRLVNLTPAGAGSVGPYVAAYARDRSHWPRLRAMFRGNPAIEDAALTALATDAANADLVMQLASPDRRRVNSPWMPLLLDSLVAAGDYAKARSIWASISGVANAPLLFDADLSQPEPPPPFNWALTASTVGLAERQPGGRLHVIYYGQEDGPLARQLLVLPAGRYRLSMRVLGDASQAEAMGWSLKCANAQNALSTVPLNIAGARGLVVQVPADCPAQWLELLGRSSDLPQQSDVVITRLRLDREGDHG